MGEKRKDKEIKEIKGKMVKENEEVGAREKIRELLDQTRGRKKSTNNVDICGSCYDPAIGDLVMCDKCLKWYHESCLNLGKEKYEKIKKTKGVDGLVYLCPGCLWLVRYDNDEIAKGINQLRKEVGDLREMPGEIADLV